MFHATVREEESKAVTRKLPGAEGAIDKDMCSKASQEAPVKVTIFLQVAKVRNLCGYKHVTHTLVYTE